MNEPVHGQNQPVPPPPGAPQPHFTPYVRPEPEPAPSSPKEWLPLAACLISGYFLVKWLLPLRLGLGITLDALVFLFSALGYMKLCGVRLGKAAYAYFGLCVLSSLQFFLFSNEAIKYCNFLFLFAVTVYWVGAASSNRLENRLGSFFTSDLLNQSLLIPFANFGCYSKVLKGLMGREKRSKTLSAVLIGIILSLPVLIIVLPLLVQADVTFRTLMQDLFNHIWEFVFRILWPVPFAILTAFFLFGLLYGNLQKRYVGQLSREKVLANRKGRQVIPIATSATLLCLLCLTYLVFFGAQAGTLLSAYGGKLPEGLSYSDYARQGFFELCAVAAINLFVLFMIELFTARPEQKSGAFARFLRLFLCLETLLLIVSAFGKMALYIERHGLTAKRVYTSWFMAMLFLIFSAMIVHQFKRINLVKTLAVICTACFMVLCFSNMDHLIVRYNMDRYKNGTLSDLDFNYLYQIGPAAVPDAKELYLRVEDREVKVKLAEFLGSYRHKRTETFAGWNVQSYLAEKAVQDLQLPDNIYEGSQE